MKNTGTLRIQAFAARQSSPVEGVTVTVSGNGFTATRLTDAEGNADDVTLTTPACALSLDENNTTQPPYVVCDLVASKPGYRTVRIQGVHDNARCKQKKPPIGGRELQKSNFL